MSNNLLFVTLLRCRSLSVPSARDTGPNTILKENARFPLFAMAPLLLGESPTLPSAKRSQLFPVTWKGLGNLSVRDLRGLAGTTALAFFPGAVTFS